MEHDQAGSEAFGQQARGPGRLGGTPEKSEGNRIVVNMATPEWKRPAVTGPAGARNLSERRLPDRTQARLTSSSRRPLP